MSDDSLLITLDVDWAPDFMIRDVARRLESSGVRATWFVTHPSDAIEELKRHPALFELGIHPNFMPGSTQGDTPQEVLDYLLAVVPGAVSVRNHGLVQSTQILDAVMGTGQLKIDATHFLPLVTGLVPFAYRRSGATLVRVPCFFEDDFEMEQPEPRWDFDRFDSLGPGLKVFNFHPVHVYLNSCSMTAYEELKEKCVRLAEASPDAADELVETGVGAGTLFDQVVEALARRGGSSTISQCVSRWSASNEKG